MSILFVAKEIKSEILPQRKVMALLESSRPWDRAVDLRVKSGWSVQSMETSKSPGNLHLNFVFSSLSYLFHFSTSENVPLWQTHEKKPTIILISGPQSATGVQAEVQWAGHQPWGCCGTGWYCCFSFLTTPKEVKNDVKSDCFGVQLFGLGNEMGFFQLPGDAIDVCGVSILEMMGIANLCVLFCLVIPPFDWQCQIFGFWNYLNMLVFLKREKTAVTLDFQLGFLLTQENSNLNNVINRIHMNVFILP